MPGNLELVMRLVLAAALGSVVGFGRDDLHREVARLRGTRRGQLGDRYGPVGRLLEAQSRLGLETFAFDPAEEKEAGRQRMQRAKVLDHLRRQHAGTHCQCDARG